MQFSIAIWLVLFGFFFFFGSIYIYRFAKNKSFELKDKKKAQVIQVTVQKRGSFQVSHCLSNAYVSPSGHDWKESFQRNIILLLPHDSEIPLCPPAPRLSPPWDVCADVGRGQKELSYALCLLHCPTPIPRGTGFLARDQVSDMRH
jgi:hypothetical protein